jgi:hypothetical protein
MYFRKTPLYTQGDLISRPITPQEEMLLVHAVRNVHWNVHIKS